MNIKYYINSYFDIGRNGNYEEKRLFRYKLEKGIRRSLSRVTQSKPVLAFPVSQLVRIFSCKECKKELEDIMARYKVANIRGLKKRRLLRDIYYSEFNYRIDSDEYFRYHFENLSNVSRKTYVGTLELIDRFIRISDRETEKLLSNKYEAYKYFKQYYKREAILISDSNDLDIFKDFCAKHAKIFVKPISKFGGEGVKAYSLKDESDIDGLFKRLIHSGTFIVEQQIIQGNEMAKFHPQSINTVRVVTAYIDEKIEVVQTSIRLGVGESIVDNGCLSASIDPVMGIISSPGRAAHEKGLYLMHPDTGVQILGSKIPDWEKLLELVKELAHLLKKQKVIGWDLAYSSDGWIVVEANTKPSIQILAGDGVGIRPVFERITRIE